MRIEYGGLDFGYSVPVGAQADKLFFDFSVFVKGRISDTGFSTRFLEGYHHRANWVYGGVGVGVRYGLMDRVDIGLGSDWSVLPAYSDFKKDRGWFDLRMYLHPMQFFARYRFLQKRLDP